VNALKTVNYFATTEEAVPKSFVEFRQRIPLKV